jgi:hypothetical protein
MGTLFSARDGKLVIEIDFETWAKASEHMPGYGFVISDVAAFEKYVRGLVASGAIEDIYSDTGSCEIGQSIWTDALDKIVEDAYENGEGWLSPVYD